MKRWQDRGEVQDSDDEELSLDAESQSPERARKKPRLDDQHLDEDHVLEEQGQDQDGAVDAVEVAVTTADDEVTDEEVEWLQPKQATTYGRRARESNKSAASHLDSVEKADERIDTSTTLVPSASSWESQVEQRNSGTDLERDSPSEESEELPDVSQILLGNNINQHDLIPEHSPDLFSVSSSPLSEREVSPPAPEFRLPGLGHRVREAEISQHGRYDHPGPSIQASLPEDMSAADGGRRNLRARNEKQLHPYMFDRVQFQRQFRERGLQTFRFAVPEPTAAETQDASMSGNESSSQLIYGGGSSPVVRPSSPPQEGSASDGIHETYDSNDEMAARNSGSEEELPDLPHPFRRPGTSAIDSGTKRRKLFHSSRLADPTTLATANNTESQQQDEFSVPPSPPPTSSDNAIARKPRPVATGFRMPRGLTPAPLPTPQISSDRRAVLDEGDDSSDPEHPFQRSRAPTASGLRQRTVTASVSPASSDSELPEAIEQRRLGRERKRIRGVLPASWLRIDLRAQQKQASPSPARRRRTSSASPPPTMPQRGVAQRVNRARSPDHSGVINISDDDSEAQSRPASPSATLRQPTIRFKRERTTTATNDFIDDERMEVDWIDPMFAGSTRKRTAQSTRKRQPKIKDAFTTARRRHHDFSEERNGLRQAAGIASTSAKPRQRRAHMRTPKPTPAHNLSIMDAPEQRTAPDARAPPFVRLAMRTARARADQGRHSPTRKDIRLAREEDTADAEAVLRAWREGTMAPKRSTPAPPVHYLMDDGLGEQDSDTTERAPKLRAPLTELSRNQQQRLPGPLRKERGGTKTRSKTVTVTRRPRVRQTRLQPTITLARQLSPPPRTPTADDSKSKENLQRSRMPPHLQPQAVRFRGAQLESLEHEFDRDHRTAAFERRMQLLTENVARGPHRSGATIDFQLNRFLHDAGETSTPAAGEHSDDLSNERPRHGHSRHLETQISLPHGPRKRQARRLDAETRQYRQPSEPLPEIINLDDAIDETNVGNAVVLEGLKPFGTRYATDFDVLPLALGTYFHESSFIGSGDFAASLDFSNRCLDVPTGRILIHLDGDVLEWGAWTEDVAVGMSRISTAIADELKSLTGNNETNGMEEDASLVFSTVDYLLRSTVRYFARCLAFLDPVDRRTCISRLQSFMEDILEAVVEHQPVNEAGNDTAIRCLQYAVVLASVATGLCDHPLVQLDAKARCNDLVARAAQRLARTIFPNALAELRAFHENNRQTSKRESGIKDTDTAVCSMVILHHVLEAGNATAFRFWTVVYQALNVDASALTNVAQLDKVWYDIFTLLPILEIDKQGIARVGSRTQGMREDWSLVKRLIDRLFELYPATSLLHGSTVNEYVRVTLVRCYRIISTWGWWKCESILGTVFDFFAQRGLAQLHKEESRGSVRFLEGIDYQPSMEVQAEDRSFHIFLKMLASSLQGMRKHSIYSDKKIGGIAWRFIPNHGRTHRKDAEVRQEDLDALRNHHDLLCTLYYATPPDHRLRVALIQNLVNHSTSHREACRLNIRAWANLATFQMSSTESKEHLEPFVVWFRDILGTTINQYRLARTEVEQDVASTEVRTIAQITQAVVEDTIARNQRRIAATLVDGLAALKRALRASSSLENTIQLLEGSVFWQVFDLFDPGARRLSVMLDEALEVAKTALEIQAKFVASSESQPRSDDSQDYGDSTALQELASGPAEGQYGHCTVAEILHDPVSHLLSNVFGADTASDDALLIKLVDLWSGLAQMMVQSGKRSWTNYIGDYYSEAWDQLRDTEHRRKFTPYFLSCIVGFGNVNLSETSILIFWLKSLVERDATLKFQHGLTNALLIQHPDEQLLHNLPFSRRARDRFDISLHELRQRRTALLSSVLSNMGRAFDDAIHDRPHTVQGVRRAYAEMLKQLTQAMKSNYQELQTFHSADVADVQAQGAYVEFVQQVVSFMQQYTTDICPVDRFFTDSAAFPLPAADPMYVVGRLRSYVPKLAEPRKRKELAVFVQTVSERAAVDNQQPYLVGQLVTAMAGVLERGNVRTPSLRHVLMTAVFPAYIGGALTSACSWIIAKPILQSCGRVAADLLYNVVLEDDRSLETVAGTIRALLHSILKPVKLALLHPGLVVLPHVQTTLAVIFGTVRDCLTCVRYLEQCTKIAGTLTEVLADLMGIAGVLQARISEPNSFDTLEHLESPSEQSCPWPDTLDFSRKQIRDKFNNDWYAHDGQYYVRRGNTSVEVVVALKDEYEERLQLLATLEHVRESYGAIFIGRGLSRPCGLEGLVV
ncbi:hypothetical protein LTR37_008359 [Vermiconidia calcicola]|uniref:Uncharacterized protein n=1 Tax=Vermiconidia calcicola TaxID=1690605 RepID=A0ACC3NB07_9PEZI|nr:hypothetical protein LTR37_008359 [Vermiconidia calcicola]